MCAWLASDGFDTYSATADITERWDSGTIATIVAASGTAFAVGQAVTFNASQTIAKAWGSNEATVYATLRTKQSGTTAAGNIGKYVQLQDSATAQLTIRWNEDTSISVLSGGLTGTLLGTVAVGAFAVGAWDSWQVRAVIHASAGSVEIRKNGNTTPALTLSGVNTRGGTANSFVNRLLIGCTAGIASTHSLDDLFVNSASGADPATWPGDLRAVTQAPTGTAQAQFSQSPSTTTWGQLATGTTTNTGASANSLSWYKFTAPFTGSCSQIAMNLALAITGKVNLALYSDSSGAPDALLAQASEKTNPAAGTQTFALGSTTSITKGTTYWFALWSNVATTSSFNGTTNQTRMLLAATYSATFPATAAGAGSLVTNANASYFAADLTSIAQYSLVADATQDADTSYVFSATVGQEDLFSFPSMASLGITPASFVGVLPFGIVKKSDSGARTIDIRAMSGVTDHQAATNASPGLTYAFLGGFLPTDPATSAAWTLAAVDALQVGPKVAA